MKIITERTESILSKAKLPDGTKSLLVPDNHPCMDEEQKYITNTFKAAFGAQAADATFKVAIDKKGERRIYEPSVLSKDGKIVIDWGGKTFSIPTTAKFLGGTCTLEVEIEGVEYSLRVRVLPIEKKDAKGKTQMAWATVETAKKGDFLVKEWAKGTIVELLAESYPTICKLAEIIGTHQVVGYKMGTGDYPKYLLTLADKRVVRANTALHEKLVGYAAMEIEVSPECPAQLTVGTSTSETSSGFAIYPTTLISHRNVDLPVYDFGFSSDDLPQLATANGIYEDQYLL